MVSEQYSLGTGIETEFWSRIGYHFPRADHLLERSSLFFSGGEAKKINPENLPATFLNTVAIACLVWVGVFAVYPSIGLQN